MEKSANKEHEGNEQIMLKLYLKVVEDQNKCTKEDNIMCEMKNGESEEQTDRNEDKHLLSHRTAQFYTLRPTPFTKDYKPRHFSSPTDHNIRSQENPKRNEKQKGPGIVNLTSDVMILGGEESGKQITNILNELQAYESTLPYVQIVHMDTTKTNGKGSG